MINSLMQSIGSVCRLYNVSDYIPVEESKIAIYNAQNDDFHVFRWETNRYILCGIKDTIPDWLGHKVGLL